MKRRDCIRWGAACLTAPATGWLGAQTAAPLIRVWKDPNCGCCNDWIRHLHAHGFRVQAFDSGNAAMRQRLGIPPALASCHTAQVGGYVIEGHVPAADIQRLLRERPAALGLAVPRMPVGSPGMDGPEYGNRRDPYDVLLVQRDGATRIYASYPGSTAPAPHGGHGAPGPASADAAPSAAGDDWATGEIRRIDDAAGKITLRHGPIPHLDMPPMTMVFQVRDRALLQGLQPGQTVRFRALHIGGAYIVTDIKAGP
ncbi:DUF411 domain-containing protein [Tepidimonas charontis]|uniref:Cation efflux system protein CusF n=1 Tax=Tepidimonas charontis TaxID=2267262 RepID=A0A554X6N5_9BURK|nr:Cation efflux system protein CusF [Tepidimonas charontis]